MKSIQQNIMRLFTLILLLLSSLTLLQAKIFKGEIKSLGNIVGCHILTQEESSYVSSICIDKVKIRYQFTTINGKPVESYAVSLKLSPYINLRTGFRRLYDMPKKVQKAYANLILHNESNFIISLKELNNYRASFRFSNFTLKRSNINYTFESSNNPSWDKFMLKNNFGRNYFSKKEAMNIFKTTSIEDVQFRFDKIENLEFLNLDRLNNALAPKKVQKIKQEKVTQQKIQQKKLEKEILEQQKIEQVKLEQEQLKQEKIEQEKLKQQKIEQEKQEQEKLKQQKTKPAKVDQKKLIQHMIEQAKLEQERLKEQKPVQEKLKRQKIKQTKVDQKKLIQQMIEQAKLEQQRLKEQKIEQKKLEQEKLEEQKPKQVTSTNNTTHYTINTSIVILMDISESNKDKKLNMAKKAVLEGIDISLHKGVEIAILAFSGNCNNPISKRIHFTSDKTSLRNFVHSLSLAKGTAPLGNALKIANNYLYQAKSASSQSQMIILLANGDDNCKNASSVINNLKNKGLIFKHQTISLGVTPNSKAQKQLQSIAQQSGGIYYHVKDNKELPNIFKELLGTMEILDMLGTFGTTTVDTTDKKQATPASTQSILDQF